MDIFTTMITPYTADGKVDYETAIKYVNWYFENGLNGIFAICQGIVITAAAADHHRLHGAVLSKDGLAVLGSQNVIGLRQQGSVTLHFFQRCLPGSGEGTAGFQLFF